MRRSPFLIIWLAATVGLVLAVLLVLRGHSDLGNVIVAGAALCVAAYTLQVSIPSPAELWVERQSELGISDLIFYIYPVSLPNGAVAQQPADFVVQLHLAVCNIGGRKGVVTAVELTSFQDKDGETVELPEVPLPLHGHEHKSYRERQLGVSAPATRRAEELSPPFILEPDDVITMRFRVRRGIDWTERWTLEALRGAADKLRRPIAKAEIVATYRAGRTIQRKRFSVDVLTEQQALYVLELVALTHDFSQRPDLPTKPIDVT